MIKNITLTLSLECGKHFGLKGHIHCTGRKQNELKQIFRARFLIESIVSYPDIQISLGQERKSEKRIMGKTLPKNLLTGMNSVV